jgi:hypothetical protein
MWGRGSAPLTIYISKQPAEEGEDGTAAAAAERPRTDGRMDEEGAKRGI